MDWELWIRKISKNSHISLKLNSTHLMINPSFNESPHKNDIQWWSDILITYLNQHNDTTIGVSMVIEITFVLHKEVFNYELLI